MFSEIDKTIFPDSCEVLEILPSQLFVYPIFKCGSSSLYEHQSHTSWKTIVNQNIGSITAPITVFLRDPRERFISGVNTFVQLLLKQQPSLDTSTILYFVNNYFFLNRHYAPQFFWLINLARYIKQDVKLNFEPFENVSRLTPRNSRAGITPPTTEVLQIIDSFDYKKLELYFFLDQQLTDRIGQLITWNELIKEIQQQHPELYKLVFSKTQEILNVLPKT